MEIHVVVVIVIALMINMVDVVRWLVPTRQAVVARKRRRRRAYGRDFLVAALVAETVDVVARIRGALLLRFGSVFPVDVHVASQGLSVGEAALAIRALVASSRSAAAGPLSASVPVGLIGPRFVVLFARYLGTDGSLFPRFHTD